MTHRVLSLIAIIALPVLANANDLSSYLPLSKAVTAKVAPAKPSAGGLTGYLGVSLNMAGEGRLVIGEVAMDSPADKAGIKKGDVVERIDGKPVTSVDMARSLLQSHAPGDSVAMELERGQKSLTVKAQLTFTSNPKRLGNRAIIGVGLSEVVDDGILVKGVIKDSPAAKAKIRPGDIILSLDGVELGEARSLPDALSEKQAGDKVKLQIRRKADEFSKTVTLEAGGVPLEERRELKPWKKPVFNIAVVLIEFADNEHNEKIELKNWSEAFFSKGTYNKTNVAGQPVYGSMNDYYQEVSCGKLAIKGKVFPWLKLAQKQSYYSQLKARGASQGGMLVEVMDKFMAREGDKALEGFDGIGFIYAGEKGRDVTRGNIFWPHRSSLRYKGKSFSYVIVPELAREKMTNISVMCHETGHSLGLPDLYARPENPGSEGVGRWCVMSNQVSNGRPQHFSAWSKEQLGWLTPVVIDPTVKQKLVLGSVEGSTTECLKVLVRRDGSEYLLLENRRKKGFDESLPDEGLLIWRVVENRPILEESHGITGPSGPRVFLSSVPYPSKSNNSFTPYTTPSSRSQLGGGMPVHISNIRQLPDGRISLQVGYEFE